MILIYNIILKYSKFKESIYNNINILIKVILLKLNKNTFIKNLIKDKLILFIIFYKALNLI